MTPIYNPTVTVNLNTYFKRKFFIAFLQHFCELIYFIDNSKSLKFLRMKKFLRLNQFMHGGRTSPSF